MGSGDHVHLKSRKITQKTEFTEKYQKSLEFTQNHVRPKVEKSLKSRIYRKISGIYSKMETFENNISVIFYWKFVLTIMGP